MTPTLLTIDQAAALLGIHRTRVWQLIQDGRLPAAKFGRDYQIRRADLLLPAVTERRRTGRPRKEHPA